MENDNETITGKDETVPETDEIFPDPRWVKKQERLGFLYNILKGITLGISAAVPGLSAGTIAVAERCYDTLVDNISSLKAKFRASFLKLLPFILGAIVGAVAALIGIQKGYQVAPFTITGLFGGFVVGSLPVAVGELRKGKDAKERIFHIVALALCLAIAAGLGIVTALTKTDFSIYLAQRRWWMYILVLVAGFIAAAACVIPGISGSMSLMVIGMYLPILNTYATRKGDLSIFNSTGTYHSAGFVITGLILLLLLAIGALLGLAVASRVMKKLLSDHRVSAFYGILGLIVGSLISMFINSNIWPRYFGMEGYSPIAIWDYIVGATLFVLGALGVFFLIRYSEKKRNA